MEAIYHHKDTKVLFVISLILFKFLLRFDCTSTVICIDYIGPRNDVI